MAKDAKSGSALERMFPLIYAADLIILLVSGRDLGKSPMLATQAHYGLQILSSLQGVVSLLTHFFLKNWRALKLIVVLRFMLLVLTIVIMAT